MTVRTERPRRIAVLVLVIALARPGAGQDPEAPQSPPVVVRVSSELVQVDAIVTDGKGNYVTDLTADDFEIVADGRRRPITNFRYVTLDSRPPGPTQATGTAPAAPPAPRPPATPLARPSRSLAIVVDDLSLSFESTVNARNMLNRLVDESLDPGDLVAVLRTGSGMGALHQFTTDRRLLKAAIAGLSFNLRGRGQVRPATAAEAGQAGPLDAGAGRDPDPMAALVAREADAVRRTERERQTNLAIGVLAAVEAVVRALAPLPGRKSLLFISEGFVRIEEGGEEAIRIVDRIRRLVDTANRASVVIYCLDPGGLRPLSGSGGIGPVPSAASAPPDPFTTRSGTTGGMSSGMSATQVEREMRAGLTELSQDTGGLTLFDSNDPAQIARVIDDQRGYYLLGYVPDEPIAPRAKDKEPRYFKIDVKVKRKGLNIRSRKGFVATATAFDEAAPTPGIVDTVMSPFAAVDVPVRLTALYNHDRDRGPVIRCLLHVDAQTLTFEDNPDGTKQVVLETVAAAIDARGRIARHIGATYTMTLGARMAEAARRGGFALTLDLPVKESGAHQVRVAARDTISGHAGSASQFLVVPDLGNGRLALTGIVMEGAPEAPASEEASLDDGTETWRDPDTTPAVRRFRTNGSVAYGFGVYNALRPPAGGEPDLAVFLNLYRDGTRVQSMVKVSPAMSPATTETPIAVASALRLGSAVPPGSYTLEVMVADRLRSGKDSVAVQSVDFEVVP